MKAGNACASVHCGIRPLIAAGAVCRSQFSERAVLKALIKPTVKSVGVEIKRLLPTSNFGLRIARVIVDGGYTPVFDEGADIGIQAT